MAEYDGSIRIGVVVQLDNAKKQLENLRNRMDNQTKEIEKQSKAVRQLKTQYDNLTSKSIKLNGADEAVQKLKETYIEVERLTAEMDHLSEASEGNSELAKDISYVRDRIEEAKKNAISLRNSILDMNVPVEEIDRIRELAHSVQESENKLSELQSSSFSATQEINETSEEIARLSEELRSMKENAVVADQGIVDLQQRISELKSRISDLDAAGIGFGYKDRDDAEAELSELKAKLRDYINTVKEAGRAEAESDLGESSSKLQAFGAGISSIASRLKSLFVKNVNNASRHTKTLHDRISKVGRNRGFDKAGKSAGKLGNSLKRIGKRILGLASSALIFNVLSRGFTELTKRVGEYLNVNKQFISTLATVKGNLLTAFQPIYENIMPALNELMGVLQQASAVLAKFMAQLFGTTAEKAQANAKALHDQAKATEEVADETKKAEKFLASFDTIEILGNKDEDKGNAGEKENEKEPAFDQDYSDVEVPKWLEVLKDEIKELMDILSGFFNPLKDSWDKYGPMVMDALKSALSAVWELIKAIARTFMEIWTSPLIQETLRLITELFTNILGIIADIATTFRTVWEDGEGKRFLENMTLLLNTILGIINDIAIAFRAAWDNYGEEVVRALFFVINSVLELLIAVGQAFRDAWNDDGRGQKILETILQIITNIFNFVGELANRLKEAWEANGNGQAIWAAILDSVQAVLDFIHKITTATVEWAKNLDLEPLIEGVRHVLENLAPLIEAIGEILSDIYNEYVLPFLSKLIEEWLPGILEKLASIFSYLTEHKEDLREIIEVVIAFIAAWKLAGIIKSVVTLAQSFNPLTFAITSVIAAVGLLIANWSKMDSMEQVLGVIGAVTVALGALCVVLFAAQGGIAGVLLGVAGVVAGISMIGSAISSANKRAGGVSSRPGYGKPVSVFGGAGARSASAFTVQDFAAFKAANNLNAIGDLPHLANGAVISPNHEFMAVLGDQRSGKNIEAPLSTIEQALENVLSRQGNLGGVPQVDINFRGSLSQLARILQPEITIAQKRSGSKLTTSGGFSHV